jgi:hypothetical protein
MVYKSFSFSDGYCFGYPAISFHLSDLKYGAQSQATSQVDEVTVGLDSA